MKDCVINNELLIMNLEMKIVIEMSSDCLERQQKRITKLTINPYVHNQLLPRCYTTRVPVYPPRVYLIL